jgi:hypothetical protein
MQWPFSLLSLKRWRKNPCFVLRFYGLTSLCPKFFFDPRITQHTIKFITIALFYLTWNLKVNLKMEHAFTIIIVKTIITKKEGSYLHTELSNPWCPDRPHSLQTSKLSPSWNIRPLIPAAIHNESEAYHTWQHKQNHRSSSPSCPHSYTHKYQSRATFSYYIHILFTHREPKLFL